MARRPLMPARTAHGLRRAALVTLLAFLPTGCGFWRTVPVTEIQRGEEKVDGVELRFELMGDPRQWHLLVDRVELPFIEGTAWASRPRSLGEAELNPDVPRALRRVDLRTVQEVEIYSPGRGVAFTIIGTLAILAAISLIAIATKSSCPFVYVDGPAGPAFAGEAYSGATTRAVQRDDLLPLPPLSGPVARLRLANEARETQLTDRLELVLVDHGPGLRALATFDARPVLVGAAVSAAEARDLDGNDVTGLVRADDGASWSTDMDEAARRKPAPRREGLVATFPPPPPGTRPVLELRAGNTPLLDVVFGRFYALAGDGLAEFQQMGADPQRAPEINAWRLREGVDLLVETWRAGRWERAAVVPTPGPVSKRTIAVPLPPFEAGVAPRVRISGGVGFWTVDRVGLSPLRDEAPVVRRLAPATALDAGVDARPLLAATDGRYHVLPDAGAVLPLTFDLPPSADGQVRDAFLDTNGYYLLHTPPQAVKSVMTLRTLWNDDGALARFTLDLYRGYQQVLAAAPPVALSPREPALVR